MAHDRAPFELRIHYTVQSLAHIARVPLQLPEEPQLGTEFDAIVVNLRSGATTYLDFVTDDVVALIRPFFGVADDITIAELWKNNAGAYDSTFISSMPIELAGTGAAGAQARQLIFTARTEAGGVVKFFLMEHNVVGNTMLRPPFPAGGIQNFSAYMTSDTTPFYGRDSSFAYASLGAGLGENEKLFRKRFRPT